MNKLDPERDQATPEEDEEDDEEDEDEEEGYSK